MSEKEYCDRLREFDPVIRQIGMHNPIVAKLMQMYARGHIVTHQEALSQMIVELAKSHDAVFKQNMEYAMMNTRQIIIPQNP